MKTDNLFWLGRYIERVYSILHFFRKYVDVSIDIDCNVYKIFCDRVGILNKYNSHEDFVERYLFDKNDPHSLISALIFAHGNGIVLREEIKTETLSYIQMAISHIEKGSLDTDLQPVTDNLLAFWGALDEMVFNRDIRNFVKIGKYLESLDLHLRFDYSQKKIAYCTDRLEKHIVKEPERFDLALFSELKRELQRENYDKYKSLEFISKLFVEQE
ncbi:hypothetical protein AGMMS49938_08000 [Fibrobacterales bacterium]|nr:hypothetical protein AGMMS49938_08000 [Fibrobacterales bacterium]